MFNASPPREVRSEPPLFKDRAEAGLLLGEKVRDVLGRVTSDDSERSRGFPIPAQPDGPQPAHGPALVVRVFAIPRGGVAVAAGVARCLAAVFPNTALDVIVVRKIGHPEAPELGLGAIAEGTGPEGQAAEGAGAAGMRAEGSDTAGSEGPRFAGTSAEASGAEGTDAEPVFDDELLSQVGLTRSDLGGVVARERAELDRRMAVYHGGLRSSQPAEPGPPCDVAVVVDDGLATGVTARAALRAVRGRGVPRIVLAVPVAAQQAVAAMEEELAKAGTGEVVTLVTSRRFRSVGEWYADFGQLTDADVLTLLSRAGAAAP